MLISIKGKTVQIFKDLRLEYRYNNFLRR